MSFDEYLNRKGSSSDEFWDNRAKNGLVKHGECVDCHHYDRRAYLREEYKEKLCQGCYRARKDHEAFMEFLRREAETIRRVYNIKD